MTDYTAYLRTPQWRARRKAALERADHRCQVCNSGRRLEVHHRTYAHLGAEEPMDLTVLCEACHETFHTSGRLPPPPGSAGDPLPLLARMARAVRGRPT